MNDLTEPVPNRLRILAAQENLGNLVSIHRPATRAARYLLRDSRIYLYDQGFVLCDRRGGLGLFRWEQIEVAPARGGWLVTRGDGARFRLTRHWTDYGELGQRLTSR